MNAFQENLEKLAELAVRVGLNLEKGQEVIATAPIEAVDFVRLLAEKAYAQGASLFTVLYGDNVLSRQRLALAPEEGLDRAPAWLYEGMAKAFREGGAARLAVSGNDPKALEGLPPERIGRAQQAQSRAYKPALEAISQFVTNWTIVPFAHPGWARAVFPSLPEGEGIARLWQAIFQATRVDAPDPVAAWEAHNRNLHQKVAYLNERRFQALHFQGPGTDLIVGLAEGHLWQGGATPTQKGRLCNPNLPTEEVFTAPHRERVEGVVRASRPLALGGQLVEGLWARFEGGYAVAVGAEKGEEVLLKVLATDEGARRLGEVALVAADNPIAKTGLVFFDTLFDENAASHIAFGQAYAENLEGRPTGEELRRRGGNESLVHIDWMIGSEAVDVDGLLEDGTRVPLMRRGLWVV
ncbi:aminopeptidase [Thermus thermamylovorans]|uniref:Aminopeptidase n=1 Tax=Thermus thermamylovorans TaxID=2509362 RepID=A0A4Q9B6C4_9DEIN|nr:aminopeptidase [Thermus thermamylovorans]TBH20970.1 aminopeptidase [Thermus thermamylovorans]